jgi:hypothetical protein
MEFSSVRVPFRERYIVSVQLAPNTEYGYDKLSELTKLLGTTDLRFVWYSGRPAPRVDVRGLRPRPARAGVLEAGRDVQRR